MSQIIDLGGNDLVANNFYAGATAPGQAGVEITAANIETLAGVTAGTVTASKAVVVDANKDIATFRNVTLSGNLVSGATTLSEADLALVDGLTAGTVTASKAVTVDASKNVATIGNITSSQTATTPAANVDGTSFTTSTEVALGNYANALNAKLDFGTAGSVTGLGGAVCSELDLGPGSTSGSYACFEGEMNCPASASTGTRTSFLSLNAWGANVAAIDSNANLFDINGLTASSGKLFNNGLTQAVTASARLRVNVGGTPYYIPLCAAEALTS